MLIRILFGWLRSPNVSSVSALTVILTDNASAAENAVFASQDMGEKLISTYQFSYSTKTQTLKQRIQLIKR